MDRGRINNRDRASQQLDFSGLSFKRKTISPTDLDGMVDFSGKAFIFFEGKLGDAPFPGGQKKAIENLCVAMSLAGYPAIAIFFRHEIQDFKLDVPVAETKVTRYFYGGKWHAPNNPDSNVKECADWFQENHCKGL